MPNGRNAGRLFADCYNIEGYGEIHGIVRTDGTPLNTPWWKPPWRAINIEVMCIHCNKRFMRRKDANGKIYLEPLEKI